MQIPKMGEDKNWAEDIFLSQLKFIFMVFLERKNSVAGINIKTSIIMKSNYEKDMLLVDS